MLSLYKKWKEKDASTLGKYRREGIFVKMLCKHNLIFRTKRKPIRTNYRIDKETI